MRVQFSFNFPVIVVLEDLHWSDGATLALLSAVARRRQPARLLIIGTYRTTDLPDVHHPLLTMTHELRIHRQCQELPISLLSPGAVAAYLAERLSGQSVPDEFARAIYHQTEGNPLFLVDLVDHVLAQSHGLDPAAHSSLLAALRSLPENLRQMLIYQIDRLNQGEQHLLEAASVAGIEFSAETVAAALHIDEATAEHGCDGLVQRHLLVRGKQPSEEAGEGRGTQYTFRHALFHQVVYNRLGAARRRQFHQQVGEQKERAYGSRAVEMAAELAIHFTESGDAARAVQYLQQAARTALQRSAHHEANTHLTHALEWLQRLAETPEQSQRELELSLLLGVTLMSTQGFSSPHVQQTYAHARHLCQQLGTTPQFELRATMSLCRLWHAQGKTRHARHRLAALYDWFTEGFDTPELQKAKALLAELC